MLIGKYQRRLPGFDDKLISLYTHSMSTREIQGHLEGDLRRGGFAATDQHGHRCGDGRGRRMAVPPAGTFVSVMFFNAIRVKVRDQGSVCNKAVYLALGITRDGRKHILGLGIDPNEGAKFWLGSSTN